MVRQFRIFQSNQICVTDTACITMKLKLFFHLMTRVVKGTNNDWQVTRFGSGSRVLIKSLYTV